ncbi:hypothetical protein P7C73_g1599, partial [Tremellales sp. Uapishka_1]
MSPSDPPTFQRALLAGAISGLSVDFLFFPLDTIKTRLQSSSGFIKSGGLRGIYSGVGSVGAGSAPGAAAFFTTYETLKTRLAAIAPSMSPALIHVIGASGGELVSCLIRVPTEIVKSRTQTAAYGAGSSTANSFVNVLRNEGVRGFYRGYGITIAREVICFSLLAYLCVSFVLIDVHCPQIPFTSIQFPLYEFLKTQLSTRYLDGARPSSYQAAGCGMFAGGVAAALTTPLDVVKTRVMLEAKTSSRTVAPNSAIPATPSPSIFSLPPRLIAILRQEGPQALFAGWKPRTTAISLGGAVFLGVYDFFINVGRDDAPIR